MTHCRFIQATWPKQFLVFRKYLEILSRHLDSYENIALLGEFNMTPKDKNLQHFTDTFSLEHPINEPTCFKRSLSCRELLQKYLCNSNWNI